MLTSDDALFNRNGFIHYGEQTAAVGARSLSAPPAIVPVQTVEEGPSTKEIAARVVAHDVLTSNDALFNRNGFVHYGEPAAAGCSENHGRLTPASPRVPKKARGAAGPSPEADRAQEERDRRRRLEAEKPSRPANSCARAHA